MDYYDFSLSKSSDLKKNIEILIVFTSVMLEAACGQIFFFSNSKLYNIMTEGTKISKKEAIVFFILIIIGFCFIVNKANKTRKEIENYPDTMICKYTFCKPARKSSTAVVKYVVNNKLYRTSGGSCPENSSEKINKFFYLKYATINPDNIEVDFTKEVTNKAEIEVLEHQLKNWFDLE